MFTGIVEELGVVTVHTRGELGIRAPGIAASAALGDSVATNGVCLTVARKEADVVWMDYSATTREVTAIGGLRPGDRVNLEQALTLGTRLGGHLVMGHVDGVGQVIAMHEREGVHLAVSVPQALTKYMVPKGSITVDGVSLTIVAIHEGHFDLTIIPHTWRSTALQDRRPGDRVNLEVDILGKYVERLLGVSRGSDAGLTLEELARQGF